MKKIFLFSALLFCGYFSRSQNFASSPDYFPISVFAQAPYDIQTYKNAGINLYVALDWGNLDASQLASLHSAKMYVMPDYQDTFALNRLSDTLIYGWWLGDEPDNAQWNSTTSSYDSCINPKIIIGEYNSCKAKDPSRPAYINLGQGVANTAYVGRGPCSNWIASYPTYDNGYLSACDIGSFDIYPVNSSTSGITDSIWYVAKGMDSLIAWSKGSNKPMWAWIETTEIDNTSAGKPTPAQVKSEVWMVLIHGAKGFGYFCDSWIPSFTADAVLQDTAMVSAITKIDNQVTSLAPVLNSASTTGYASVNSSNSSVPINFMTKNYGGNNYIFSVAMHPGAAVATFTVTSGNSVTVLGENRNILISAGTFTDTFASDYQVHLYKITSSTSVIEEAYQMPDINIYPSPFSSSASIEIINGNNYPYNLIIADLEGKIIYEAHELYGPKITLNRNGISRGMYLCYIKDKTNTIIGIRKIVIQ